METYKGRRVLHANDTKPHVLAATARTFDERKEPGVRAGLTKALVGKHNDRDMLVNAVAAFESNPKKKISHLGERIRGAVRKRHIYAVTIARDNGKREWVAAVLPTIHRPIEPRKGGVCGGPSSGHNVGA